MKLRDLIYCTLKNISISEFLHTFNLLTAVYSLQTTLNFVNLYMALLFILTTSVTLIQQLSFIFTPHFRFLGGVKFRSVFVISILRHSSVIGAIPSELLQPQTKYLGNLPGRS